MPEPADKPGAKYWTSFKEKYIAALFIALAAAAAVAGIVFQNRLYNTVVAEAGSPVPDVTEFIKAKDATGAFVPRLPAVDMNTPGAYNIEVSIKGKTYKSRLKVVDTVAPAARVVNREIPMGKALMAEDFVTDIVDATNVTASFEEIPDFNCIGTREITVVLTDEGRNSTRLKGLLTVLEDKEPPKIIGAHDRTVFIGDKVSYRRDVTVTDNMDDDVELTIDSSSVNLKREGVYNVLYMAEDVSGNITSKTVTFTVMRKREEHIDKGMLDPLLDEILANITTDDMDKREKAEAIYNWTKYKIGYIKQPDMDDWVSAAYYGIKNRKGDCFIYYSTAQALLTRAGIDNQRIVKNGGGHYWNMVNLGDGWYHFDTTPRRGGGDFFMLTDVQLEEYSKEHDNSHVWDRLKYPATPL